MRSQKGNVALIVIGLIIIVAIAVGAYFAFHKSKPATTASTSQSSPATSASTSSQAAAAPIIQTKTDSSLGRYLADSNGNALYTYGGDTNGVSNCSGSCLYSWPIYAATTSSASLPAQVTIITRSDGGTQYAYKGMPLYTFNGDSAGQVTGDNVSNFHLAKP